MRIVVTVVFATSLLAAGLPAQRQRPTQTQIWEHLRKLYDKDQDGRITRAEHGRGDLAFANLDRDKDGVLTAEDFAVRPQRNRPQRGEGGERPAPRGNRQPENVPKVGDAAPDFELPRLQALPKQDAATTKPPAAAADTVKLSSFAGKRPVALIFGSYT